MGDCPNDTSLQLLLETARENGWQRFFSCCRMVELDHGCKHITFVGPFLSPSACDCLTIGRDSCHYGAQFVITIGCGQKSYSYEQQNKRRLLTRAYKKLIESQTLPLRPLLRQPLITLTRKVSFYWRLIGLKQKSRRGRSRRIKNHKHRQKLQIQYQKHLTHTPTSRDILLAGKIQELRNNHKCSHGPRQIEVHTRSTYLP